MAPGALSRLLNPGSAPAVETLDGPVLCFAAAPPPGDAGAHQPHRAYQWRPARARAFENSSRHLHQTRPRAKCASASRLLVGRAPRRCNGSHLPRHIREKSCPSPPACRAEIQLHHFSTTTPDPPAQAGIEAENIDDSAGPARAAASRIDGWKKSRPHRQASFGGRSAESFADGKGQTLYALYQERLKILNASTSAISC